MNDQPIYLEASEEITSVIDRLRKAEGKSVSFVVPAGATLIQSIVNLKLLKRAASSGSKTVEIVTNDRMGRNLASQVGFTVFGSLEDLKASKPFKAAAIPAKGLKGAAKMSDIATAPAAAAPVKVKASAVPDELPEEVPSPAPEAVIKEASVPAAAEPSSKAASKASKSSGTPGKGLLGMVSLGFMKRKRPLIVAGVLAALLVVILLITYVFATATITITPKADPVTAQSDVTASKSVTTVSESGTIPAQVLSAEENQNGSFQATGQKDVGTKASGTVSISNCNDLNTHTIPAGTTVSAGGLNYSTTATIQVGGAGVNNGTVVCSSGSSVGISAADSGTKYNTGGTSFSSSLGANFHITGSASGGSTKVVTVISQSDLDKAKATLSSQAQSAAGTDLKKKLSSDQPVLDGATSVAVTSFNPSAPAGTQTGNFTATEASTATLLTYHKADLQKVLYSTIQNKVADNKQIIPGDKGVQATVTTLDAAAGTLQMHGTFEGFIADKFDSTTLAGSVTGKTVSDARKTFLKNSGIAETEINIWPSYKSRLPFFSDKITIKIATPKTSS